MISESPYRHVIQTEAKPFRNLLLGFFFITVGMSLDWSILVAHWIEILVFLAALIVIKTVFIAAAARAFGWSTPGSVQLGFLLAQGSEFVFVIVAMPMVRTELGEEIVGIIITAIAASLVLTPMLVTFGNNLAAKIKHRTTTPVSSGEIQPGSTVAPIVVCSMDDIGRSVADALEAHNIAYDAIEGEYDRFLAASADGYPVALGNPGDVRLMETLEYTQREAIVITMYGDELADALIQVMKDRYPDLPLFIAVDTDKDKARFDGTAIRPVINRSVPRGLDLAAEVLRFKSIDETKIQDWMQRQQERSLLANEEDAVQIFNLDTY
jgi:hypothetical protein